MRPAILIITANLLAFGLGSIMTIWLTGLPLRLPYSGAPPGPAALSTGSATGSAAPSAAPAPAAPAQAASSTAPAPTPATPAPSAAAPATPTPAPPATPAPAPAAAPSAAPAAGQSTAPPSGTSAAAPASPAPTSSSAAPSSAAPAPAPPATPAASAAAHPGPYVLQLGAFHEADRAANLAATMQQHGFDAYTVVIPHFTLVRIGSYSDRVAAAQAAAELQAATRVNALILRTTGP